MAEHEWRLREIADAAFTNACLTPAAFIARTRSRPGVYLVYTFSQHVADRQGAGSGTRALARQLGQPAQAIDEAQADNNDIDPAREGLWYLLPKASRADPIEDLFSGLRARLETVGRDALKPALLVSGAGIWETLHFSPCSRLIEDQSVYEYLLWDGGVPEPPSRTPGAPSGDDALRAAWAGWGWIGTRYRNLPAPGQGALQPVAGLAAHLAAALDDLVGTLAGGTDESRRADCLRALGTFLPPFFPRTGNGDLDRSQRIPTLPGSWGGPRCWSGRLLDLDTRTRHLLLDGWIIACPLTANDACGDGWWLRPASLLLLAWVAGVLAKPHTEDPDRFLEGYDWGAGRFSVPDACCPPAPTDDGGAP